MKAGAWVFGTLFSLISGPVAAATLVFVALGPANRILTIDASRHLPTQSLLGVTDARAVVAGEDGLLVSGSFTERKAAGKTESELYVIDPVHGHAVLTVPVAGRIHSQAVTSDGRYVLSSHPTWNGISVFDLQALRITRYLKTGSGPTALAVRRLEPRAFVSNPDDGTVTEIDTREWQVVRQWPVDGTPRHLALDRDEKRLLIGEPEQGHVAVLDLAGGKVERRIPVGKGFEGFALGDDGRSLFISGPGTRLAMMDIDSGATRDTALGARPGGLSPISGTGTLYVAGRDQPVIWVINQRDLELLETIELPAGEGFQVATLAGVAPEESPSAAFTQ